MATLSGLGTWVALSATEPVTGPNPGSSTSLDSCGQVGSSSEFQHISRFAPMGWRFSGTDRDAVREMADEMLGVARKPGGTEGGEIDDRTLRLASGGDRDACRALVERYQVRVSLLYT